MRLRGPLAILLVFSAPALVLAPFALARGDDTASRRPAADAGVKHDPDNRTALAEWMERCIRGNAKFVAHDVPAATDLYRQAIQLAPKRPLPHYLLGEALAAAGNLAEAEAAFNDAEQTSDDRDPDVRGKILFVLADVKERQKKWEEAKTAWQAYGDYASKHADAGTTATTPAARIQAIDDSLKLDKAYEVVRQRIQDETKDAGVSKK
jgi:tetratricopeptide (TPR) repeat protein